MRGLAKNITGSSGRTTSRGRIQITVDIALETILVVRDCVGLEPIKGALNAICGLLRLLQGFMQNEDDLHEIAKRCQRVAVIIKNTADNGNLKQSASVVKATQTLHDFVQNMHASIEKKHQRRTLWKLVRIRNDARKIAEFKEALRDFLFEFQLELTIVATMDVKSILEWVKVQGLPTESKNNVNSYFTPPTPVMFFGRDATVHDVVQTLLRGDHVALIGTGGTGKSSVAKAVLNEPLIVSEFDARLFITYDGVAPSAMTYQLFLDKISRVLNTSKADSNNILSCLEVVSAILVIDNAETLLEASSVDLERILELLDTIGSQRRTRILMTTRNHETVPPNLAFQRIPVAGLPPDAAIQAFGVIYQIAPVDKTIERILAALDYHALSINILANTATMNQWSPARLDGAWDSSRLRMLETAESKHRNLRVSIEISLECPLLQDTKDSVLRLLRVVAFLPQGVHREALTAVIGDRNALYVAESVCRCSLAYWRGEYITALAPIRLYIADTHNNSLAYDNILLTGIRHHYYRLLSDTELLNREHDNLDRLIYFDMSSSMFRDDVAIYTSTLEVASRYLCVSEGINGTSLWPLLMAEVDADSFHKIDSLALTIGLCMSHECWADLNTFQFRSAFGRLKSAEKFCRNHTPTCDEPLIRCLIGRSQIYHSWGKIILAEQDLQEARSLAQVMSNFSSDAMCNSRLSRGALSKGSITEAITLADSALQYCESSKKHLGLAPEVYSDRIEIAIHQKDYDTARNLGEKAMKFDRSHRLSQHYVQILTWQASVEGWAGNISTALEVLDRASLEMHQIVDYKASLYGKAYYQAILGNISFSWSLLSQTTVIAGQYVPGLLSHELFSSYIFLFSRDLCNAKLLLRSILSDGEAEDKRTMAFAHRALGEIAILEQDTHEAKTQFSLAKSVCDESGMSPRFMYTGYCVYHWHTLPEEYDGWSRYLDGVFEVESDSS